MIVRLVSVLVLLSQLTLTVGFIKQKCRGTWSAWGRWKGQCTEECSGVRVRHRACVNTGLFYCGTPQCSGSKVQYDVCGGDKVDGEWGAWSSPDCHYCNQKRMRTRKCNNPAPKCGGADCRGASVDIMYCGTEQCPSLGKLVPDTNDYRCGAVVTVSCPRCHKLEGGPTKLKCLPDGRWNRSPPTCSPLDGIDAQWSAFGPWNSHCKACNQVIYRTRECRSSCGEVCQGNSTETYICGNGGCSINAFVTRSKHLVSSKEVASCGETIKMSCKNEKILLGGAELGCGLGGWSGPLSDCVDQRCPSLPNFEDGRVMSTGLTYGKFSHFICNDGYEIVGQQYLVCLGTHWSYQFPTCRKKVRRCPEIELTEHLAVNSTSNEVGAVVTLSCESGFQIAGEEVLTCEEDAEWDMATPTCSKYLCPPFPEIGHAVVIHSDSGRSVNISCETGYELAGAGAVSCLDSGEWSSQQPVCKKIICQIPHTDNGRWYRVLDRNIALLRCDRGYVIEGNGEIVCGTDNEWESDTGSCVLQTCAPLPTPLHGTVLSNDTSTGSIVKVACDEGYEVAGHWKLQCLKTGLWDYEMPQCKQSDCTVLPTIQNGYISSQNFSQGSVVSVVCELGYKLEGESSVKCLPTGHWSAGLPTCKLFGCVAPGVDNGTITHDIIPIGKEATISCHTGFKLRGRGEVLCNKAGIVEVDLSSVCLPVTCPLLSVDNGDVVMEDVIFDSVARVKCHYGYRLHNSHENPTCLSSGNWSSLPKCQKTFCSSFPDVKNGYLEGVEGEKYEVGAKASVMCNLWYIHEDKEEYVTCLESGDWSTRDLECTRMACPKLEKPKTGRYVSLPGSAVGLTCDEGYKVRGGSVMSCKHGRWNETLPARCVRDVQCPTLPDPYSGVLSTNDTDYNTQVYVKCNNGHVLSSQFPVVCNSSGQWNSTLPSCSYPNCPDISGNGVVMTGTKTGDTARLECSSCEKRSGSRYSVCLAGGRWEPPIGSCKTVTCNTKINRKLYESVEGGIPTKCGKSVTFMCKPGYTTIGRTTITCYDTGQYDYHVPFCVQSGIFKVRRLKKK